MRLHRLCPLFLLFGLVSACSTGEVLEKSSDQSSSANTLYFATTAIQDKWQHLRLKGATDYRLVPGDGSVVIRAEANGSASGLIRNVDVDTSHCPTLEWRWRVGTLQRSANLKLKAKEDVAASIFLLFGDPGFLSNPQPVPTLRYVWTNDAHTKDEIIDNPYLPGTVRSIVVRTGESSDWVTEKRNMRSDYQRAFGSAPKESVYAIVLFTDNDQTKEPAIAFYHWAKVYCDARGNSEKSVPTIKDYEE